jgi:hypothetical protein
MERAVHPALQKRIVEIDPASGKDRLREMSAKTLVQFTRDGGGRDTPKGSQQQDVTVFDVYCERSLGIQGGQKAWPLTDPIRNLRERRRPNRR